MNNKNSKDPLTDILYGSQWQLNQGSSNCDVQSKKQKILTGKRIDDAKIHFVMKWRIMQDFSNGTIFRRILNNLKKIQDGQRDYKTCGRHCLKGTKFLQQAGERECFQWVGITWTMTQRSLCSFSINTINLDSRFQWHVAFRLHFCQPLSRSVSWTNSCFLLHFCTRSIFIFFWAFFRKDVRMEDQITCRVVIVGQAFIKTLQSNPQVQIPSFHNPKTPKTPKPKNPLQEPADVWTPLNHRNPKTPNSETPKPRNPKLQKAETLTPQNITPPSFQLNSTLKPESELKPDYGSPTWEKVDGKNEAKCNMGTNNVKTNIIWQ